MVELTLHIEYLLQHHDCVVLPGIGAIVASYVPAQLDFAKDQFIPFSKNFSFNPELRHDDGLMASSYARRHRLSHDEGRQMLSQDLHKLRLTVENNGSVELGSIGCLTPNANGTLNIQPLRPANVEMAKIGCSILNLDGQRHTKQPTGIALPQAKEGYEWKLTKKSNYYIPLNKIFAKSAASILLVFIISCALLMPGYSGSDRRTAKASLNPVEAIAIAGHKHVTYGEQTDGINQSATMPLIDGTEESLNPAKECRYYLIVGTFHNAKDATNFLKTLHGEEQGIVEHKGVYRVYTSKSESKETLREILNSPSFHNEFNGGWIWESQQ